MLKVYFFKNRYKKHILKKIYELKESAAQLSISSKSAKQNADDLTTYINIRLQQAQDGSYSDSVYLAVYLEDLLEQRDQYLKDFALFQQKHLNVMDSIQRLEIELEKL